MARRTPWGDVQHSHKIADGIEVCYTAGHGGIILSDEKARRLKHLKHINFLESTKYWEEDCDWAIPFIFFQTAIKGFGFFSESGFTKILGSALKTIELQGISLQSLNMKGGETNAKG